MQLITGITKKTALLLLKMLPPSVSNDLESVLLAFYQARKEKKALKKITDWMLHNHSNLKIVLYDLGARSDLHPFYTSLKNSSLLESVGFEPGENEFKSLQQQSKFDYLIPKAVAGKAEVRTIYITKRPGCSSLYEPNTELLKHTRVSNYFEVVNKNELQTDTLKNIINEHQLPAPDYLKMDIQGAEFEVLNSLNNSLSNITGIHLEAHMKQLYKGEGLFCDIHDLLTGYGFTLIRNTHHNNFEGEILEVEVAYVNQSTKINHIKELLKAVIFCCIHKNIRFAAKIVRTADINPNTKKALLHSLGEPVESVKHTFAPDMKTGW